MSVVRWILADPVAGDSYTMQINPNTMTSPFPAKNLTFGKGQLGATQRIRTFMAPSAPVDWQFGGVIRSQAQHDDLLAWFERDGKIHVTDHLGRTFEVLLRQFEVVDRKPTKTHAWLLTYTMHTLCLREV